MKNLLTPQLGLLRRFGAVLASAIVVISGVNLQIAGEATAANAAAATIPATVSADPLPTVQINGIVLAQVTVGNTVYATGAFTSARPAGSPLGSNETSRGNLLAYDITTGNLITTFNHPLNGRGRAVAVSADGTRLYVGGSFSTVDGAKHTNLVGIDLKKNSVLPSFATDAPGSTVTSISAANNGTVYVGGQFSTTVSGAPRNKLAAYTPAGALTSWAPSANGHVAAVIVTADQSKVVIGGSFTQLNSTTYHSIGAVSATTGASILPWASTSATFPIRDEDPVNSGAGITSFSREAGVDQIFLTAFTFISTSMPGGFEGRASISPFDGHIIFMNDCHGDSYSAFPIGGVLYSVSHEHDCTAISSFREQTPRIGMRADAETITVDGVNIHGNGNYWDHSGQPRSTQLEWYPILGIGNVSGAHQAAWSVTGNANYVALGGEFPTANGKPQQGLVRYTIRSAAPNKIGPAAYTALGVVAHGVNSAGQSVINLTTTSDPDDEVLTYKLYRDNGNSPVYTTNVSSHFLLPLNFNFTDSGLAPGSMHQYRLVASDPYGNSTSTTNAIDDTNPAVNYAGTSWVNNQSLARGDYYTGIHYSSTVGDSASFKFSGSQVSFLTETSQDRGSIDVYIDGTKSILNVTAYAPTSTIVGQKSVYTSPKLAPGAHTIKVVQASGRFMVVDGFIVDNTGVYDDTNAAMSYIGSGWINSQNRGYGDYDGGIHYTTVNGSQAKLSFNGSTVKLITEKNADRGNIAVSIDGGQATTLSVYAPSFLPQQNVFTKSGLASGNHTITITKISGSYMDIDALLVSP
jgi:hypothetical protein